MAALEGLNGMMSGSVLKCISERNHLNKREMHFQEEL